MTNRDEFEARISTVHWSWFNWSLTLSIPRVPGPKWNGFLRGTDPDESFMEWMSEIRDAYRSGPHAEHIQFIRVKETRELGEVLQHVLIYGVPSEHRKEWQLRWWGITAGAAWERKIGGEMKNLIRYFHYKKRFDVEFGIDYQSDYCRATGPQER